MPETPNHRALFGLFDEDELAVTLGVTAQTLATWRSEKQGPDYAKLGKSVFYRFEDIMRWIASRVIAAELIGEVPAVTLAASAFKAQLGTCRLPGSHP